MLKDKIEKYYKAHPQLRVLFFFDKDQEFKSEVEALELEGIRLVQFQQNYFFLKTMLHGEWKKEKVFLYLPMDSPKRHEEYLRFPLLDLLIANKELLLDDEAALVEEYRLQRHQQPLVKRYMRELRYDAAQKVCAPILKPEAFEEAVLVQALFSYFLKFKAPETWSLLLAKMFTLLRPGQEDELKRFTKKVRDNNLLEWLNKPLKQHFNQEITEVSHDSLAHLLKVLKYNALTQLMPVPAKEDPYQQLKITKPHVLHKMNQVQGEANRRDGLGDQLQEAIAANAEAIQELKLMDVYGADADFAYFTISMKWQLIAEQTVNLDYKPDALLAGLNKINIGEPTTPTLNNCLTFLTHAAEMVKVINAVPGYILDTPEAYTQTYTTEWYKIDQAYRNAICAFRSLDDTEVPKFVKLDDLVSLVNKRYEEYLEKSNREWLSCLRAFDFNYKALKFPKQYDFYKTEVAPLEQKTAVIISDALRYEAAEELLSALHGDPKNSADIRYQVASLPSVTSVGMAQLLPGVNYSFNGDSILVDGLPANGAESRNKILQAAEEDARVVTFNKVTQNNQEQNRELFRSKLVYIYHDSIDMIGDKRASERKALNAVREAIEEIKLLVKKLHGSLNVSKVIITADHGFLYNDCDIEETDKENATGLSGIATHNRYELVTDDKEPELGYKIPLSATTLFNDDISVVIPASVNRYKKQGVGHQFVHGGGSLQELVVPVIESTRKRQDITQKVQPIMLNQQPLKVVSNVLRLNILQKDKVSRTEKAREIVAGLYKNSDLVSNNATVVLNSASGTPSERTYRLDLNLQGFAAKETLLKLKIFDKEDMLNPLIEAIVQNNTLIESDF